MVNIASKSIRSVARSRQDPRIIEGARTQVARFLNRADIVIGGSRPWDIQVHDERFYTRVLAEGSLELLDYAFSWNLSQVFKRQVSPLQGAGQPLASLLPWRVWRGSVGRMVEASMQGGRIASERG